MKKLAIVFLGFLAACGDLAEQDLAKWKKASDSAKDKVIAAHFSKNSEYVKKCMNRTAMLPNTEGVRVIDAGNNCLLGLELRERSNAAKKAAIAKAAPKSKNAKSKK